MREREAHPLQNQQLLGGDSVSIAKTTNETDLQCSDMKVSKKALWHLLMDLVIALVIAGIAYGLLNLASRALAS
jgi:hypothetical protein